MALSGIEPFTCLRDTLAKIQEHPINQIEELLPVKKAYYCLKYFPRWGLLYAYQLVARSGQDSFCIEHYSLEQGLLSLRLVHNVLELNFSLGFETI
jgi:hypothetical protein